MSFVGWCVIVGMLSGLAGFFLASLMSTASLADDHMNAVLWYRKGFEAARERACRECQDSLDESS